MHGHTRNAIVKRFRNGYRPSEICREMGIDLVTLAAALVNAGVFTRFRHAIGNLRRMDR